MITLICTVGGSHQPIENSINTLLPDHVIFVCSKDDDETGFKGSYISVEGKGMVNKSKPGPTKPDLPNLLTLCQLSGSQFSLIKVPPDDLTACYFEIQTAIKSIDTSELIADYTGGTKTMSAALAMIAADHNLQLNLVVGTRSDHIKVKDGSEESVILDIQQLRYQRSIKLIAQYWQRHAYQQAQSAAESIPLTMHNKVSRNTLIQLSKAFAAWDCFDHEQAADLLDNYRSKIGRYYASHLTVIKHLMDAKKEEYKVKYTPYLIIDVWNNAERKAAQGYYDDAIARVYRVLEWTAQWILLKDKGWQTAELPDIEFPPEINITTNRQGQKQAGLYASWQLVQLYADNDVKNFVDQQLETMMNHIKIRNDSILAHGFKPVANSQWQALNLWMVEQFLPVLKNLASKSPIDARINEKEMQLPKLYPAELLN